MDYTESDKKLSLPSVLSL